MSLKSIFIRDQLQDIKSRLFSDNVFNGGATLAYYLTLSVFPGLIFLFSLAPYLPLPDVRESLIEDILRYLPPAASSAILETVLDIVNQPRAGLLSVSFLFALWAASSGTAAIMKQMNIAYRIRERRPFIRAKLTALALTGLLLLVLLVTLALIVLGEKIEIYFLSRYQMRGFFDFLFTLFRWIMVVVMVFLGVSLLYYYGPNTKALGGRLRFLTGGTFLATFLIMTSSALFSLYVNNFSYYNKVYGGLAGVMILMIWFYFVGVSIMMGAEFNNLLLEKRIFLKILKHIK